MLKVLEATANFLLDHFFYLFICQISHIFDTIFLERGGDDDCVCSVKEGVSVLEGVVVLEEFGPLIWI